VETGILAAMRQKLTDDGVPSRRTTRLGLLIGVPLALLVGARAISWAAVTLKTWNSGDTLTAADLNANFTAITNGIASGQQTVRIGAVATACDATSAGTLRFDATAAQLQFCDGTAWVSVVASSGGTTSCQTIKTANPNAANGMYALAAAGVSFQGYCDMSTGGWTLIQSHLATQASVEAGSVPQGSGKYLPGFIVRSLAASAHTIRVQLRGTNNYAESNDGYPIAQLRGLRILTDDANAATASGHWTVSGTITAANLNYSCATQSNGAAYPSLYWACGNGTGLHILADPSDGTNHGFMNNSQDLDVWLQ
jgi:hypothetical protein